MRKLHIAIWMLMLATLLSAAHNFTINGEENPTISVGDSLEVYFEFESVGNSASYAVSIELLGYEIPAIESNDDTFADGGMLDETDEDGVFMMHLNNFVSIPEAASVVITVTDEDIYDSVTLQFEQLDSNYSISGTVTSEGSWFDLPVPGALVYCFYNVGIADIMELIENFSLEEFLAYMQQGHYLLSEMTGLLGTYQIYVPDDVEDATCLVGVLSLLDIEGDYVAPDAQIVQINGHIGGIDFYYADPDGYFEGIVMDAQENPISNASIFVVNQEDTSDYTVATSDSTGAFSIPLLNGTYDVTVVHFLYTTYEGSFTISNGNHYEEIVLHGYTTDEETVPETVSGLDVSCYPNPFNPEMTVSYNVATPGETRLSIFDVRGRVVYRATNRDAGTFRWNGVDLDGKPVASGIYLVRIQHGNQTRTRKAMLLK